MALKATIINEFIKYLASKLAENQSFQRLSLNAHEKIEGLRRTTMNEFINYDPVQTSIRRIVNKLIKSGKDFIKKSIIK